MSNNVTCHWESLNTAADRIASSVYGAVPSIDSPTTKLLTVIEHGKVFLNELAPHIITLYTMRVYTLKRDNNVWQDKIIIFE